PRWHTPCSSSRVVGGCSAWGDTGNLRSCRSRERPRGSSPPPAAHLNWRGLTSLCGGVRLGLLLRLPIHAEHPRKTPTTAPGFFCFWRCSVEKTTNKPIKEEVIRECPPLGKYRLRL